MPAARRVAAARRSRSRQRRRFRDLDTPDEVSVICPADQAPDSATIERPWRCFRVDGPVNLALTGILASLITPLADARVNVFAFSTFDTDYVLIPAVRLSEARSALVDAGHRITG